jgi:PAS domain S-box-containing protein
MAKKGLGVSSDENKALRERDKYRSLFEESIDAIFITDRNGVFLEVNQATLTLFGYTIEEMKNSLKASDLYVHPGDRETFRVEIEQKGAVRDYPARLRKKDGTQMRCLLNFTVRLSDDGGISGYQGIIRDVTEQQRAQEELQRANNELKTFIDVISHELKNPILVIQGFANRLMNNQGQMLGEKGRYYLEHIQTNARRMESLVCELLLLSKAGRADYHFKQVSCLDIVNNVTSSLREDLEDEQIALVVEEDLILRPERDFSRL